MKNEIKNQKSKLIKIDAITHTYQCTILLGCWSWIVTKFHVFVHLRNLFFYLLINLLLKFTHMSYDLQKN